tara:strand:- start:184 stop:702 length:519 start_codon:yes stop_codon:yes gene_type:complete
MWTGIFGTPASKKSKRKIDMTPSLVYQLKKYKLSCPRSDLGLVFSNSCGNPLDPDSLIKRQFLSALRRSKIRRVRFHDLRHSNVAMRIEQGQNIKYIQVQLGHASIQTALDRYGHLINDVNSEEAKKLDAILGYSKPDANGRNEQNMMFKEIYNPLKKLVAGTGFEPATFGL